MGIFRGPFHSRYFSRIQIRWKLNFAAFNSWSSDRYNHVHRILLGHLDWICIATYIFHWISVTSETTLMKSVAGPKQQWNSRMHYGVTICNKHTKNIASEFENMPDWPWKVVTKQHCLFGLQLLSIAGSILGKFTYTSISTVIYVRTYVNVECN